MVATKQGYALYSGIIGVVLTPILMFIAFIMEPTYNPFLQTISKLGVTDNGQLVFILSACIGGSSLIIFHALYYTSTALEHKLLRYARISGLISGIALIGVGVIQDKPEFVFKTVHWIAAFVFFFFTIICIFFQRKYLVELNREFNLIIKFSLVPIVLVITYVVVSLFSQEIALGLFTFKLSVIWQKMCVLSFIIWYLMFFYCNPIHTE